MHRKQHQLSRVSIGSPVSASALQRQHWLSRISIGSLESASSLQSQHRTKLTSLALCPAASSTMGRMSFRNSGAEDATALLTRGNEVVKEASIEGLKDVGSRV
eukprot:1149185-Pelagomonas_calceolata.AAC.1